MRKIRSYTKNLSLYLAKERYKLVQKDIRGIAYLLTDHIETGIAKLFKKRRISNTMRAWNELMDELHHMKVFIDTRDLNEMLLNVLETLMEEEDNPNIIVSEFNQYISSYIQFTLDDADAIMDDLFGD